MQRAREVNLLLFSYANDYDGQYPTGKSSTEIFQKLIDEKYAVDPSVFYLPLPGKVPPVDGEKLKPENVGFDVTSGVVADSSDQIPVAFETGYKITYAPGAAAVPLSATAAQGGFSRTWTQWWNGEKPLSPSAGIAVGYKSNSAMFIKANADGAAPNFISPEFKPDGRTYQQLTPDGVAP